LSSYRYSLQDVDVDISFGVLVVGAKSYRRMNRVNRPGESGGSRGQSAEHWAATDRGSPTVGYRTRGDRTRQRLGRGSETRRSSTGLADRYLELASVMVGLGIVVQGHDDTVNTLPLTWRPRGSLPLRG
jgi:hypothetical protein